MTNWAHAPFLPAHMPQGARWKAARLPVGQVLREPGPLFKKLDRTTVVEEELARLQAARSNS